MVDKDKAIEMYKQGLTFQAIGDDQGVTRQRINQIVKSLYTPINNRHNRGKANPSRSELWVGEKLLLLGYSITHRPYMDLYDILVNDTIRVEVKHVKSPQYKKHYPQAGCFQIRGINKNNFDFLIVVCGDLIDPICYIIPSDSAPTALSLPVDSVYNTKRQRLHREAWELLNCKNIK